MIDYFRLSSSKIESGYDFSVTVDLYGVRLEYLGKARSLMDMFRQALIFIAKKKESWFDGWKLALFAISSRRVRA